MSRTFKGTKGSSKKLNGYARSVNGVTNKRSRERDISFDEASDERAIKFRSRGDQNALKKYHRIIAKRGRAKEKEALYRTLGVALSEGSFDDV